MTRTRHRAALVAAVATTVASVLALAGCAPALPESVVPGTEVTVGWTGELTSTNAAAAPTTANLDVAAMTRGSFGAVVSGEFVADTGFGTATIVREKPFTVRYDLAEPSWSDGIPLDAADLLLGWAAGAGLLGDDAAEAADAPDAAGTPDATDAPDTPGTVPVVDEFARAIEVEDVDPAIGWQSAIAVSAPAHVVGRLAFGLDDAMEAKQAVIRAIESDDRAAIADIATAWRTGFDLAGTKDPSPTALISSGPYLVESVSTSAAGQTVALVPNTAYRGAAAPQVARIELAPAGEDPASEIGARLDIARVAPTAANAEPLHLLERRDVAVQPTSDGTLWTLRLRPAGVFSGAPARAAFLRLAPISDMIDAGAGEWASAYTKTTVLLAAPGTRAAEIVAEDSGFTTVLGTAADDAAIDREAAGVGAGSRVCVLYDRTSEFAAGAFSALAATAGEAGWAVADCGSDDVAGATAQNGWDAVIERSPLPQTPAQIAAAWGSGGEASADVLADQTRDDLIAQYAQTVDPYAARDLLAQVEATIVNAAIARPLATNPVLTLVDPQVTGVTVRDGGAAALTFGAAQWIAGAGNGASPMPSR